ncbi:MAG: UvrD-helicase domain-containing protein [Acidobacteriota bacterium]
MKSGTPLQQRLPFGDAPIATQPPVVSGRRALVIEAGAGTGKTTSIVCELLSILMEEPDLSAERIVLVTFTEKAAGEIAARVREAITSLHQTMLEDVPRWPAENPIFIVPVHLRERCRVSWERHFQQLDRFQSQTIHAFCQRLLRLYPLEAGLNPQFTIVHSFEQERIYDEIFADWFREETRAHASDSVIAEWEVALHHFGRLDAVQSLILEFVRKRDLIADDSYTLGTIEDAEPDILRVLDDIREADPERLSELRDPSAIEVLSYLREHRPPREGTLDQWSEYFEPVALALDSVHLGKTKSFKLHMRFLRGEKNDPSIVQRFASHRAAVALRALTRRFITFSEAEKQRRGIADFDDLLFRTDALLENGEILEQVRKRFDYLFIDEFQDTDRVQAHIVEKLARDYAGGIVPGRTVLVGDPKQSIYSFRRADPETYQELSNRFVEEGAERRVLTDQYRSDAPLVADLNTMFEELFSVPSTANVARPGYEALTARKRSLTGPLDARLTFLRTTPADAGNGDERQAHTIARWIQSRVAEGAEDFRGFALLFRKLTNVELYLETFDLYGIPYVLPPSRAFLLRRAAVDLMAILRAIAYPFDDSALISAARSPYFALSDLEIVRHYFARETGTRSQAFETFLSSIRRYSGLARNLSVSALIDTILRETEIEVMYAALADGSRSLLHLQGIRDIALEFDIRVGGALGQFVDEITRRRGERAEAEPTVIDEKQNAVNIMTVHGAKGLEFDTVILPDLSSAMKNEPIRLFAIDDPRTLIFTGRLAPLGASFRQSDGQALQEIGKQRLEAELDRLFYVAVTRARSDVVFVTDSDDRRSEFWKCLERIFQFEPKTMEARFESSELRTVQELGVGFGAPVRAAFERVPGAIGTLRPGSRAVSRTIEEMANEHEEFTAPEETPALPVPLTPAKTAARRQAARNKSGGILLHRLLEIWDGRQTSLAPLLEKLSIEQQVDSATKARVRQRAVTLSGTPFFKTLMTAQTVGREFPVFFATEQGDMLTGRIDRLLLVGDRYVVVDYKSGRSDPGRLERDREQVRRYCAAVSKITSKPCEGVLWYVDDERDEVVKVETTVSA